MMPWHHFVECMVFVGWEVLGSICNILIKRVSHYMWPFQIHQLSSLSNLYSKVLRDAFQSYCQMGPFGMQLSIITYCLICALLNSVTIPTTKMCQAWYSQDWELVTENQENMCFSQIHHLIRTLKMDHSQIPVMSTCQWIESC